MKAVCRCRVRHRSDLGLGRRMDRHGTVQHGEEEGVGMWRTR
jgi:hypothetical protein